MLIISILDLSAFQELDARTGHPNAEFELEHGLPCHARVREAGVQRAIFIRFFKVA